MMANLILYGRKKILPFDFNPALATFTPGMAKRAINGPFATAPIVQGKWDVSAGDYVTASKGSAVSDKFFGNYDAYQGSISFWFTPEWNGNDGKTHFIFTTSIPIKILKHANSNFYIYLQDGVAAFTSAAAWVAGTTYHIVCRWDTKNTIDGTNYACISVNDTHTFAYTSAITPTFGGAVLEIGGAGSSGNADAIIQGLTIYRRPLYDGTYGIDAGNGDEINLIYAAGAGLDPTLLTGSNDVVFALPTNGTAGALVTGNGEAWSHPHSSNVLKNGWLNDGFYGGGNWAVIGTNFQITFGLDAGLDNLTDNALTVEMWVKINSLSTGIVSLLRKGTWATSGWFLNLTNVGNVGFTVGGSTTSSQASSSGINYADGKWHLLVGTYDDAGDRKARIFADGKLVGTGVAVVGTVIDDSASNVTIQSTQGGPGRVPASQGWVRISNNIRYAADFVPARTPPAVDANTIAQWNMTEGTGTTVDNAEGTVGRDGTITSGTWEEQWVVEGTPKIVPSVEFNGTTTSMDCGSGASIDNLHDAAFSGDVWVRADTSGEGTQGTVITKQSGATGWSLSQSGNNMSLFLSCATTAATATVAFIPDGKWHLWSWTWDDAGDRKIRLYKDRVLVLTSAAGVGAVNSDAANNLYVGNRSTGDRAVDGAVGIVRLSNVVRDIVSETWTRETPPAVDANTVLQLNMNEGAGNPQDTSGNANHGTLTNGVWNNTPDMATDSPGARIYQWGEVFGSDAADEGIKQTFAVTAGADYRIRALGYSEDGVGKPKLVVYDETNAAIVRTMDGTTTSLEQKPDIFDSCFEVPAGCTSLSVKLLNAATTGVVGWHQAMLLTNLWDDPGFEVGTAPTNVGTPTSSAQSNEQAHSGTYSWKVATSTQYTDGIKRVITGLTIGKFYSVTAWVYSSGLTGLYLAGAVFNNNKNSSVDIPAGTTVWKRVRCVIRATATSVSAQILGLSVAGQIFYVDDVSFRVLDDVSLTVTPASAANSVEGTGIAVNGGDTSVQPLPVGKWSATRGRVRWKVTFRHGAADFVKFGVPDCYLLRAFGDANNLVYLRETAANRLRLSCTSQGTSTPTDWDCTGAFVAGTTYTFEIVYSSSQIQLKVNGTAVITTTMAINFAALPTSIYFGSSSNLTTQADVVISPP